MRHYSWTTVEKVAMNEQVSRKVIAGEKAMVAQFSLVRGGVVPTHHHESEQFSCVLKGAMKFMVGSKEVVVREGEVLHIPSNVPHGAVALEDTLAIEVFSPPRPDWLKKP